MAIAAVPVTPSAHAYLDRTAELVRALRAIAVMLIHEADVNPSTVLAYGRPHEHARNRYLPRYSRSGTRIPGTSRLRPDCPKPVRGRCECAPDGSWRPVVGVQRADARAVAAELVRNPGTTDALWVDVVYVQRPDGIWICLRPWRRALERLRGDNLRKFLVLDRLFDGQSFEAAWDGLGTPNDPIAETLSACRQVERWAAEEASAEYERRPRRWRSLPWTEMSESQQAALLAGQAEGVVA